GEGVPIGRPIANTRLYLLDAHGQPAPLGAMGELYIGGIGVARGYLNRPDLTAERFLHDPFSDNKDARMYKTGDLARYLPDGNLEFLGRNDHQLKIRGFRIEPGEIEALLVEHPQVREATVLALGEVRDKRLVAYVVSEPDEQLAHTLRVHLAARLPEYMTPAAFVRLDRLPLTPNGKLDRRALPAPDDEAFARHAYEAPQGEIETALAAIWTDLLKIKQISRHDNFFSLGGHSLLAVQMIEHLRCLGLTVSMRTLFNTPTLSVLAQSLDQHREVVIPPNLITPGTATLTPDLLPLIELTQIEIDHIVEQIPGGVANIQDIYALSPLQNGILFHHLFATEGDPYLLIAQIAFANRALLDRYLQAVQQVVNRHDILRTAFVWESLSTPAQVVLRHAPLSITEHTFDPADGPITEQLIQSADPHRHRIELTQAPLLRFIITQNSDGRWLLVQLLHHLITDHSTLEAMRAEIHAFLEDRDNALSAPQPFRNLVAQARLGLSQEAHERFFTEMLAEIDEPTLPFGLTEDYRDGAQVTEAHRMLSQDLNDRLRTQAKRLGVSLASLCHLAWAQVLARASGQQQVVFGTVLLGRMQAGEGIDRAMGLFINMLPLCIDLNGCGVQVNVRQTHARLAALLEHEHASLALAQRCSSAPAGTALFSALLNYRHNAKPSGESQATSGIEFLSAQERSNYPLVLSVEDFGAMLGLTVHVVQPLDPARVCGYMQQTLQSLAEALEHTPDMPACQLESLPNEEREHLLEAWNATTVPYLKHQCIHQLFEEQVVRTPEATALVYEDQVLSYAELNARANLLAHQLIKLGVQPDARVAICVERSPAMVVGLLAILKAGGAYVPLDPAVSEIFTALGCGASLYLPPEIVRRDRNTLWNYLKKYAITHATLPPALLQDGENLPKLSTPLTLILAGEAPSAKLLQTLADQGTIFNAYGPTETTVCATAWSFSQDFNSEIVSIGRPISNTRIYLLDPHGQPVPLGAIGELYIGGAGVARGYLNRPELTDERFLPDPFSERENARMYKTGDLARYLPDGNLIFLGRNDHQVKIRGFRIELGEIKTCLVEHPQVREATVLALGEGSNKRLIAYVVAEYNEQLVHTLREYLTAQLPDYMVPAAFVRLDALPLTPNGKLDRRALPAPDDEAFARHAYEAPQGEIETALAAIWTDLLKIKQISRHDNFFALGGHSLLAVQMISRIYTRLGLQIALRTLFEAPSIKGLTQELVKLDSVKEGLLDILLPIQPNGARSPLFCVHPITGLSWSYMGLSKHLDIDQPIYGLQACGLNGVAPLAETIDAMALDYIKHIRHTQPNGPYYLLGWSFGGSVAHSIAAKLEEHGEKVALLVLLDSYPDYSQRGNESEMEQKIACAKLLTRYGAETEDESTPLASPDLWKPYVLGHIEAYNIHCKHDEMDRPAPIAEIGRILTQKLNELEQSQPSQSEENGFECRVHSTENESLLANYFISTGTSRD
ncbi:hypothetical protein BGZ97_004534, partial [Linnemannia gamsii]